MAYHVKSIGTHLNS